jgi:hypothetical protein
VVEKDRVDGLAHRVVPPEGERDVGDAPRGPDVGEGSTDLPYGLYVVHPVGVVLVDARGDGEHVGVEDDVLRRKLNLFS